MINSWIIFNGISVNYRDNGEKLATVVKLVVYDNLNSNFISFYLKYYILMNVIMLIIF